MNPQFNLFIVVYIVILQTLYRKGLQNRAKTTDASDTTPNTTLGGDDHYGVARQRRATGTLS